MTRLAPPALPELADESKSQELGRNSLGRKKKKKRNGKYLHIVMAHKEVT